MEVVLYQITTIAIPILLFLGFVVVFGIIMYIVAVRANIEKSTVISGFFLDMGNREAASVSAMLIKTFFIYYCTILYTKDIIIAYLIIILLSSIIYIALNLKSLIFETISTIAQIFLIYLINNFEHYIITVNGALSLQLLRIFLILFICTYATYFLIKNCELLLLKRIERKFRYGKKKR